MSAIRVIPFVLLVSALLLSAGTLRAGSATMSVLPGTAAPGTPVTVAGLLFPAGARGTIAWNGATAGMPAWQANSRGVFIVSMTIPATAAPGGNVVSAIPAGTSTPLALARVTVVDADGPGPTATPSPTRVPIPRPSPTRAPIPTPSPMPTPTPSPTLAPNAYVVSPTGSDADAGTLSRPWRTLQKAADTVPPGATVYVRAGVHTGFTMRRSGTVSAPITFRPWPGDPRPTIAGNGRVDVIKLSANHDIVVEGFLIQGAAGGGGSGAGIRTENGATRIAIANNVIRDNRSYGLNINSSTDVVVRANEVTGNEEGIYVSRAGAGVRILDNDVHHQDRMVVNTAETDHDDHGGVGIALVRTTGPVLVAGNRLWGNRALSHDYTWDGGAFEIYGASGVTIEGNVAWDNEMVLETGTDGSACAVNSFRRNVAFGATTLGRSWGLFLRCGAGMVVANNVFHELDTFVFSVGGSSRYNGAFEGLRIHNNIAVMTDGKVFGIEANVPDSVVIDHNLVDVSRGYVATVLGRGGTTSMATFTSWTGYQRNGMDADPRFVDAARRDYRLATGSPAIDRGLHLPGVTDGWLGAGPDIGRYERAP